MSNLVENEICRNCAITVERLKIYYDNFKGHVDDSARYTSTIMSIGYASLVSLLGFARNHINKISFIWAFIFLIISLIAFIVNEVWKMYLEQKLIGKESELWSKLFNDPNYFLANFIEDSHKLHDTEGASYYKFYPWSFKISLAAFLSAFIVLWECIVYLKIPDYIVNSFLHIKHLF
jgi:hypothetical protein